MLVVGLEQKYRADTRFSFVSERASVMSGMDEFRKFTLWYLVKESAKLPGGSILEVGCGNGGSGLMIAASARLAGVQDPVYLCDTFCGLVKAEEAHDTFKNGDMAESSAAAVERLIQENGIPGVAIVTGTFPEDWPDALSDSFRFVHLDVDIYRSMKDAFEAVWPRVVQGGIVVLDDYGQDDCPGITDFVEEIMPGPEALWFMNGSGQAIAVKR